MSNIQRSLEIFRTRLISLKAMLERAEAELHPDDADKKDILAARLAPDMLPFPYQISFTCRQAELLIAKLNDAELREFESEGASFAALKTLVDETIARIEAQSADEAFAAADTSLQIPSFPTLTLTGADYIDEWLMPNFYFHLVTAYDILRAQGLALGKGDYMSHLRPRIAAAMASA